MKCLNIRKAERGYVLATCMVVMVVIMALCTVILATVSYFFASDKLGETMLNERLALDSIGEDFITDGDVDGSYNSDKYIIDTTSPANTLTVRNAGSNELLLTVTRTGNGNGVLLWKYGE